MSSTAKSAIAVVLGLASGVGIGKAVFDMRIAPSETWATGAVKIVAAQFVGTIGAIVVFIVVMKLLKARAGEADDDGGA